MDKYIILKVENIETEIKLNQYQIVAEGEPSVITLGLGKKNEVLSKLLTNKQIDLSEEAIRKIASTSAFNNNGILNRLEQDGYINGYKQALLDLLKLIE